MSLMNSRRVREPAALLLRWRNDGLLFDRIDRIAPLLERVAPRRQAIQLVLVFVRLLVNLRVFPPVRDRQMLAIGRHDESLDEMRFRRTPSAGGHPTGGDTHSVDDKLAVLDMTN